MNFPTHFLEKIVDTLLPGLPQTGQHKRLPPASEIGIDKKLTQHLEIAHNREQLKVALQAIVQQSGGVVEFVLADEMERVSIFQNVERDKSEVFKALLFIVSADYYEETAVLEAFNWRPTPPQPEGYPLHPFDETLLDSVKSKPKLWRD